MTVVVIFAEETTALRMVLRTGNAPSWRAATHRQWPLRQADLSGKYRAVALKMHPKLQTQARTATRLAL
ncbi:hypothetical protein AS156_24465 [Bradyrhizobium macuxiense]|uniref:Uncharacterized protein n=1 Tax=Bradyrhizobium macuxiense TaxID=1755647 RepID=A0A125Q582_9BRAD|nr:hypothetical protein AS156_24465 [Bradyrhizobium macuxiense]